MRRPSAGPTPIQSVQRALRLLEVVAEHPGQAQAKDISRATGFNLATTYHLLRTLTHEGYLERLDDKSYVLGQRLDIALRRCAAARAVAQLSLVSEEHWRAVGFAPLPRPPDAPAEAE
jgi:DNA-binding IclR family transcriptional regulator